jgi:hypothetical protein
MLGIARFRFNVGVLVLFRIYCKIMLKSSFCFHAKRETLHRGATRVGKYNAGEHRSHSSTLRWSIFARTTLLRVQICVKFFHWRQVRDCTKQNH